MNLKRILISSLLIASVTSMTGCDMTWSEFVGKRGSSASAAAKQTVYAPELDPDVHELITDPRFKSLESDEPVRFETAVTPEEAASGTAVELRDSAGKKVSKMYDDGTHSDRIAGDGIYTCSYQPKAKNEESFSYTANIGGADTAPASVRYFDKITDQDVEDMKAVGKNVLDIQSKYTDSEGNVPEDKKAEALDAIGAYAKELCESGEAVEYRVNQSYDNVVVKLSSGITCVYTNPDEDTYAGSSTTNDITVKKFVEFEPTININDGALYSEVQSSLTNSGEKIKNTFSNVTDTAIEYHVKPSTINSFGANQIILWQGHGLYDPIIHSFICTYHQFNESDYTDDDITEDRLLVEFNRQQEYEKTGNLYSVENFYTCISSEYIDVHCPDLTNSLFLSTICYGTTDSVLAASFMNKNCNAYVGFSDSVLRDYANNILEKTMVNMCEANLTDAENNPINYVPLYKALSDAKGTQDNDGDETPAAPLIFGNRSFRIADVINDNLQPPITPAEIAGRGSLRTEEPYYTLKVGETIQVKTSSRPLGAGTLKWSIDDSSIATIYDFDPNDTLQTGAVQTMPTGTITGIKAGSTQGYVYTEDGLYKYSFPVIVTD